MRSRGLGPRVSKLPVTMFKAYQPFLGAPPRQRLGCRGVVSIFSRAAFSAAALSSARCRAPCQRA